MKRPADLTHISDRNGGTFPYAHIFAVIDGRYGVQSHGKREMPVWVASSLRTTCGSHALLACETVYD